MKLWPVGKPAAALFDRHAIRFFAHYYRNRRIRLVLYSLAASLQSLFVLPILYLIRIVFDQAIPQGRADVLPWMGAAEALAKIANAYSGNANSLESGRWVGDVRAHFEMTSSFGHKGRTLATIIRFMRCQRCLELGTAYGMSAMFILEALSKQGSHTHLTTVDGFELLYKIASERLQGLYPDRIACEYGWTSAVLPRLVKFLEPVDFMFHDAGHSRKDYVEDFNATLPLLVPGAVVLFDDISWNDPRFAANNPQCHKGWLEVASHPKVRWAVEIGQEMGLVLLD